MKKLLVFTIINLSVSYAMADVVFHCSNSVGEKFDQTLSESDYDFLFLGSKSNKLQSKTKRISALRSSGDLQVVFIGEIANGDVTDIFRCSR